MNEDELPPDPVEIVDMKDIVFLIIVEKDGHLRYRSSVTPEYALYVLESIKDKLLERMSQ